MIFSPGVRTRLVDGQVRAYLLTPDAWGVLSPAAEFAPAKGDDVLDHAVSADLRRAVYTTKEAVVCVADGAEVWRSEFAFASDRAFFHRPGCVLSPDGERVWLFEPDAMAGRGRQDRWSVLDARTGRRLASADLDTSGHAGSQYHHATDGHVLMDVGEGQDGVLMFRGTLDGDRLDLVRYPRTDRCLIAPSPDGARFMTVDHGQCDVAFHGYPDGEAALTLTVEAFGENPEETYVEWAGGFLTPTTALVALGGETEDEREWFRFHLVDLATGLPGPVFETGVAAAEDLEPLGDGSWLVPSPSGHPARHR